MSALKISILLHSIFSDNAIAAGAMCEQLEDIAYCNKHKMNHLNGGEERAKWEKFRSKAEQLADGDVTFTIENMRKFQAAAEKIQRENGSTRLFEGLSEMEHYAARWFYYCNSY